MNPEYCLEEFERFKLSLQEIITLTETIRDLADDVPEDKLNALTKKLHNKVLALKQRHDGFDREIWEVIQKLR